jgi:hypothetical protein
MPGHYLLIGYCLLIAYVQELRLSFVLFDVSVLLGSAFAFLICYFQIFGGASLRIASQFNYNIAVGN